MHGSWGAFPKRLNYNPEGYIYGGFGGYRTVIAYRSALRAAFLYGFANREHENVGPRELTDLKELAGQFLGMSDAEIEKALDTDGLKELSHDGQEEKG
jgi:hypothetical protein